MYIDIFVKLYTFNTIQQRLKPISISSLCKYSVCNHNSDNHNLVFNHMAHSLIQSDPGLGAIFFFIKL